MTESHIIATLIGDGRYSYQERPARQLAESLETYGGCLNASDMGVGKTSVGIAAMLLAGRKFGIICPAACIEGWKRMLRHFGVTEEFLASYEAIKGGKTPHYANRRWLANKDIAVIVDESQNCKGLDTDASKMLFDIKCTGAPVMLVTATLAESPLDMWSTGAVLGLHNGSKRGFEMWIQQHGVLWNEAFRTWEFPAASRYRLAAIQKHIFGGDKPRGIRVTVDELGEAFPASDVQIVAAEMPDGVRKRINDVWAEYNGAIERLEKQGGTSARVFKTLKQAAWNHAFEYSQTVKIPYLLQEVPERVREGYSVPVFVNYTSTRTALMEGLGKKCGIYGGQSPARRESCRLDFQQDRERIISCQIQSGGTGLDLHDVESRYPRWSYILPGTKWALVEQAQGRVRRAGGGPSIQRILYAKGTVEEKLCRRQQEKVANLKAMMMEDKFSLA